MNFKIYEISTTLGQFFASLQINDGWFPTFQELATKFYRSRFLPLVGIFHILRFTPAVSWIRRCFRLWQSFTNNRETNSSACFVARVVIITCHLTSCTLCLGSSFEAAIPIPMLWPSACPAQVPARHGRCQMWPFRNDSTVALMVTSVLV